MRRLNDLPFLRNTSHVVFAPTAQGKRARGLFNAGLATITRNGSYRAIVLKHLAAHPSVDRATVLADLEAVGLITP